MPLTDLERAALKLAIARAQSAQRAAVLRATTHPAEMTRDLERATQGPDPWDTRVAPGHHIEHALDHRALVSPRR